MAEWKQYGLRIFLSMKFITANVVDRNNRQMVVSASTVEHSIRNSLNCGRFCDLQAASVVGEVLAMRLKVKGLGRGQGRVIHIDVNEEVEKRGIENNAMIWGIINSLKSNGVKVAIEGYGEDEYGYKNRARPSY